MINVILLAILSFSMVSPGSSDVEFFEHFSSSQESISNACDDSGKDINKQEIFDDKLELIDDIDEPSQEEIISDSNGQMQADLAKKELKSTNKNLEKDVAKKSKMSFKKKFLIGLGVVAGLFGINSLHYHLTNDDGEDKSTEPLASENLVPTNNLLQMKNSLDIVIKSASNMPNNSKANFSAEIFLRKSMSDEELVQIISEINKNNQFDDLIKNNDYQGMRKHLSSIANQLKMFRRIFFSYSLIYFMLDFLYKDARTLAKGVHLKEITNEEEFIKELFSQIIRIENSKIYKEYFFDEQFRQLLIYMAIFKVNKEQFKDIISIYFILQPSDPVTTMKAAFILQPELRKQLINNDLISSVINSDYLKYRNSNLNAIIHLLNFNEKEYFESSPQNEDQLTNEARLVSFCQKNGCLDERGKIDKKLLRNQLKRFHENFIQKIWDNPEEKKRLIVDLKEFFPKLSENCEKEELRIAMSDFTKMITDVVCENQTEWNGIL